MELRRAALRRAVEVVAARGIDLERDRQRRADLRAVDEDGLIQTVERESVARAQAVVGGREVDPHDFAALDMNFRRLVFPRVLAQRDDAVRLADARHALRELPFLIA